MSALRVYTINLKLAIAIIRECHNQAPPPGFFIFLDLFRSSVVPDSAVCNSLTKKKKRIKKASFSQPLHFKDFFLSLLAQIL